uniref:Pecanex-like protein n=1 Tax=Panagrellus redivivus TaxID=6233 RepID=A0A7E4VNS1_PANRE
MLSWIYDVWTSFVDRITVHSTLHKTIEEETGDVYFRREDGPNNGPSNGGGSVNWKATEHLKQLPEALEAPSAELEASIVTAMSFSDHSSSSKSVSVRSPVENANN